MSPKKIMVFILICLSFEVNSSEISASEYPSILQNIQNTFYEDRKILIAHNVGNDITSYLQKFTKPMFLLNLNKSLNTKQKTGRYDVFIVIIEYVQDFKHFLDVFEFYQEWNSKGEFLVIYLGNEEIEEILNISWKNYVINVNVFVRNNNSINIYTYFPYKPNTCGKNITVELLGKYPVPELFPNKIPSNFQGCPITVLVDLFIPCTMTAIFATDDAKIHGFESVLMRNILMRMNLTSSVIVTPGVLMGRKLSSGEFDGLLKYLRHKECDLMIGHLWPKPPYSFEYFDISYIYFQDYIFWYVPSATLGEKWESLYLIFSITMWLSVIGLCVVNLIAWIIFTRLVDDIPEIKSISWCILETWRGLLQGSFKFPRTAVMRTLVIAWSATGFILAAAYQSQLLSILTSPIYNHQISTLQELVDSSFQIAYTGYALDTYKDSGVEVERRVLEKTQIYTLAAFINKLIHYDNKTAFIGSSVRARYSYEAYRNIDGSYAIYEIRKAVLTSYICMYAGRGFPLLEQINEIIPLFLENGLFYKWVKDTDKVLKVKPDAGLEKLSINHLEGIFGLWFLGLFISLLVFGIEILIAKRKKH